MPIIPMAHYLISSTQCINDMHCGQLSSVVPKYVAGHKQTQCGLNMKVCDDCVLLK